MTTDEILEALEELPEGGLAAEPAIEVTERLFIFSVADSWYALDPRIVKEISSSLEVYPLPCCPPYVSGLMNNHGLPCTVLDLRVLLSNERIDLPIQLILNRPGDLLALSCSDIVEIAEIPLSALASFGEAEREGGFFSASFSLKEHTVLVLSIDALLAKLKADLG